MEIKNRREDLFTQIIPPKIKTVKFDKLWEGNDFVESAGTVYTGWLGIPTDYDLLFCVFSTGDGETYGHAYSSDIVPTAFLIGGKAGFDVTINGYTSATRAIRISYNNSAKKFGIGSSTIVGMTVTLYGIKF